MRKFYSFVICLTTLLCGLTNSAWADELTVADGSATHAELPIYGYYADTGFKNQFVYSSSLLSGIASGTTITGISFYSATSTLSVGTTAKIVVRLAEISESTFSSASYFTPSFTEVYNGNFNTLTTSGSDKLLVLDFGENTYTYNGGNLLVEVQLSPKGSLYPNSSFYGISATNNGLSGYGGTYANKYIRNFLPKATFEYESAGEVTCPKPTDLTRTALTSSSATFTWTAGGEETSWQYICLPAATALDWSNPSVQTATSATATVTGLSAQTSYKFYVRAYCAADDQSKDASSSFTTPCAGESVPWSCNFESMTVGNSGSAAPACWNMLNTNEGSYPYAYVASNSGYYRGSKALYFQSSSSKYSYIILPPFDEATNSLKVSFYYRTENTSATSGQYSIGYITDITNEATFTAIGGPYSRTTTITQVSDVSFSSAPANSRIAFRFGGGSSNNYYGCLDDIQVAIGRDCSKPSTPVASDITGTSAHLSWTAKTGVTSYKYIYKTSSTAPTSSDWESASTTSNTYVDLAGLTDGTTYYFWVMCACGTIASDACSFTPLSCPTVTGVTLSNKVYNGVRVGWTTSATTNCDVRYKAGAGDWVSAGTNISAAYKDITGLSVGTTYTFQVKPNCSADGWVAAGETYTPTCPTPGALSLSGEKYNGVTVTWSAVTGISTYNLRYRKGSDSWTTVNDIAALTYTISSGLVTNEEYTIELQTECGGSYSSITYTPEAADPVVVGANSITETGATATWTDMSGEGAIGYQYILVARDAAVDWSKSTLVGSGTTSASLTSLTLGTDYDLYVRTKYTANIFSAGKKKQFTTAVNKPTSLTKGTVTSSSAQFSWTAGGGATQYQWKTTPGADWSSPITGTSVTATGLSANTSHTFSVRAYYNGKTSAATTSSSFTTPCGTESLNFSESFSSGTLPGCWTITNKTSYGWALYPYDGYSIRYNAYGTSGYDELLQTPPIEIDDKANLTFSVLTSSTTPTVTVLISKDNGTTKSTLKTFTSAITTKTTQTIDLSSYKGETVIIYFQGRSTKTSSRYFYLDDVAITRKACTTPTANTPTVTYNSATITWTDSRAEEWSVRYRTYNVGDWTVVNHLTSKTYTMTGLTTDTEYEVQVRNDCSTTSSSWTSSKRFTPTCAAPGTPVFSEATPTGGHVAWTAAGSGVTTYQYCVVASGDDPDWSGNLTTTNTYVDLNTLSAGSVYTFYVRSVCASGVYCDEKSCEVEPSCATPTGITFTSKNNNGVTVSWTAGGGETSWQLQYRVQSEPAADWSSPIAIATTPSYTFAGLASPNTYEVQVRAVCGGDYGDWTATEEFELECPAVTAVTFTDKVYNGVTVNWTTEKAVNCDVRYSDDGGESWTSAGTNISATSKVITDLEPGTEYTFAVKPSCNDGWVAAGETYTPECPTLAKPTCATSVYGDASNGGGYTYNSITINWVPLNGVDRFNIKWRKGTTGSWTIIEDVTGTTYTITGLTNLNYTHYVAVQPSCGGAWSDSVSCVISYPKPTSLTVPAAYRKNTTARVTWTAATPTTANGKTLSGYKYYVKSSKCTTTASSYNWNTAATTTNTYVDLEDLPVAENCTLYVRSIYSDKTSTYVSKVFKTKSNPIAMDWTEQFSATTLPTDWDNTSYVSTMQWKPKASSYKKSDPYALYCYSNKYASSKYAYLETPLTTITEKATLEFYYYNQGVPAKVYLYADGTKTQLLDISSTKTSWGDSPTTVNIPDNCVGKDVSIAFYAQGAGTSVQKYIFLDDVSITYRPCAVPTGLYAYSLTPDGAVMKWTHGETGAFDIRYREYDEDADPEDGWTQVNSIEAKTYTLSGLTLNTKYDVQVRAHISEHRVSDWSSTVNITPICAAPTSLSITAITNNSANISWTKNAGKLRYRIGSGAWTTIDVSGTSHTLTGLSDNTYYTVQVQADCAANESEFWSGTSNFRTKCSAITIEKNAPYEADFSSLIETGLPECWEKTGTVSVTGGALTFEGTGTHIATLPVYTNAVSDLTIRFTYSNKWSSSSTYGKVQAGYINSSGTFVAVGDPLPVSYGSYTAASIEMPGAASTARNVAIKMVDNTSTGSAPCVYVKNVVVMLTPTCFPPASVSDASSITATGAHFTWTASGRSGESYYEYVCTPTSESPDWSKATKVNVRNATVTGLDAETTYDFYVRSWCSADDQSESIYSTFTTACGVRELGWKEEFGSTMPSCWAEGDRSGWSSSYLWKASSDEHHSGSYSLKLQSYKYNTSYYASIETPKVAISDTAILDFWRRCDAMAMNVYIKEGSTTTLLTELAANGTSWKEETISIPASYIGKNVSFIFRGYGGGTGSTKYSYLDDVTVTVKNWTFTNNKGTGNGLWQTASNWSKPVTAVGDLPTLTENVYIRKPVTVGTSSVAKAKSVILNQSGAHTGSLNIEAAAELVIANKLRKTTNGSTLIATGEYDVNIGSSASGNGALVIGSHDGTNKATVNFYTVSHGVSGSRASTAQYVGTPFNDETNILYNWHNSWMYRITHDGGTLNWERVNEGEGMNPFEGYCVFSADPAGHIYWQQGTLVATTNKTISDLAYVDGDGSNPNNENLLANSWTAPIRIKAFTAADFVNTDATIYIFNAGSPDDYEANQSKDFAALPGQYSTYSIGTAGDAVIPSMQSFSVYTNAEGGSSVTLNYNRIVYTPATAGTAPIVANYSPRRALSISDEADEMKLYVNAESGYSDRVYMLEREDFAEGFENGWDARKIFGEPVAPQLYSLTPDGNMAISCVPTLEGTVLGFRKGSQDNIYTFSFEYEGAGVWYLNDQKEQLSTLIAPENTYLFYATDADQTARFIISRTPIHHVATAIENGTGDNNRTEVRKLLIDGTLYIIREGRMFDATGVAVY